jgi:nucleoside-diphosphate-sugar epimerase
LQRTNIFISGVNGWIGRSFHTTLQDRAASVEGIDRGNLQGFVTQLRNFAGNDTKQTIIHCAGLAHQPINVDYRQMLEANAELPTQLATMARDAGAHTFVLISSAKVLGDSGGIGFTENDACNPIGAYARSKLEGEASVKAVLNNSNTRLIIVRPPLVYGPKVRANFLSLVKLAHSGLPLPLLNATQPRSMIYIENLTSMVLDLIDHHNADGCYLLSDDKSLSTSDWIRQFRREFDLSARLFSMPIGFMRVSSLLAGQSAKFERLFDPFLLNTEKITALGIQPKMTVPQTISLTASWFKSTQNVTGVIKK